MYMYMYVYCTWPFRVLSTYVFVRVRRTITEKQPHSCCLVRVIWAWAAHETACWHLIGWRLPLTQYACWRRLNVALRRAARGSWARRNLRRSDDTRSAPSSCESATWCVDSGPTASRLCSCTACSGTREYLQRNSAHQLN